MATTTFGDAFDTVNPLIRLYGVLGDNGLPMVRGEFDILASELGIELPTGRDGDPGPDGKPGPPQEYAGSITDDTELGSFEAMFGPRDVGKVVVNTVNNNMHYWLGSTWLTFPGALGVPGPQGPGSNLTLGTVTSSPPEGAADVAVTGTPPNQTLNVTLPKGKTGDQGPEGPAGAISNSTDFDNSVAATDGDVVSWSDSLSKYHPAPVPSPAYISIGDGSILKTQFSGSSGTVATIEIPETNWPYRILGFANLNITASSASAEIVATLMSSGGTVFGRGVRPVGTGSVPTTCVPMSTVDLTPESTAGIFPADTPVTVNVVLTRTGSGTYQVVSHAVNTVYLMLVPA